MTLAQVVLPGRSAPLVIDDDRWAIHRSNDDPGDFERLAYAAAHVVLRDSYADVDTSGDHALVDHIDWDTTMRFRHHLAEHGFGIAEAMDTAQRVELGWPAARRLIEETGRLDLPTGFVAGAWTDGAPVAGPDDLVRGVLEQATFIRDAGGVPMIMSMPWLSLHRCDARTYVDVYGAIIAAHDGPLLIHWLGPMFLADLEGYFPGDALECILALDPGKVRGLKLSMLDADLERALRRVMLPRDQVLLTGDDWHFAELIAGDDERVIRTTRLAGRPVALGDFSHALLGILDGIAAPASLALRRRAAGDRAAYDEIMTACESLSRIVFEPPVHDYKTGLAFLSWLNGHQNNAMLVNRRERARSVEHLVRVTEAAAACGALTDAALAAERLGTWADRAGNGA